MDYLIYNLSAQPVTAADCQMLPPEEQALASARGSRYVLVRSLLRQELARRCSLAPQEIHFQYGPQGKPEFPLQPFNLSHSGDCLCLAFHHLPVGVDVERMRPRRSLDQLAARFMCPEQLQGFLSRGCPLEEFYACWCAAEALVKHAGDTMWHARRYPFRYDRGLIKCLFDAAPSLRLFIPMPGYCGAVAFTLT